MRKTNHNYSILDKNCHYFEALYRQKTLWNCVAFYLVVENCYKTKHLYFRFFLVISEEHTSKLSRTKQRTPKFSLLYIPCPKFKLDFVYPHLQDAFKNFPILYNVKRNYYRYCFAFFQFFKVSRSERNF